ncbi:uncharacterized protein [Procambarus clarkii]|uniref:uncharacterized protein n=1 Tax=Procambarus clarkii TaxID=6728 RepID=UPI003743D0B4
MINESNNSLPNKVDELANLKNNETSESKAQEFSSLGISQEPKSGKVNNNAKGDVPKVKPATVKVAETPDTPEVVSTASSDPLANLGGFVKGQVNAGQPKLMKIDLNEYAPYFGNNVSWVTDQESLDKQRAKEQSAVEQFTYASGRVALNVVPEIIAQLANMADLEDYANSDQEVGNWLSNLMKQSQDAVNEELPIYRVNPDTPLDYGDSAWWFENGANLVTSAAGFVGAGYVSGGLLSASFTKLGQGAKALRTMGKANQLGHKGQQSVYSLSALTNAIALNQAEGVGIGVDTYNQVYQQELQKIKMDKKSIELTEEEIDKEARQRASIAASSAVNFNRINIMFNLTSAAMFLKTPLTTRNLISAPSIGKTFKTIGLEGSQESAEELVNMFAQNQAVAGSNQEQYGFKEALSDAMSKEGQESALLGFIGGAGQTALTKAGKYIPMYKNSAYRQAYTEAYNKSDESLSNEERDAIANKEALAKVGNNKGLVSANFLQNSRYIEQQDALARYSTMSATDKVGDITNAFYSAQENSRLLSEIKQAEIEGDTVKLTQLQDKLFTLQAYNAFELGTTEALLDLYKGYQNLSTEEAEAKGLEVEGDNNYRAKANKAIQTIEDLEKLYVESKQYLNSSDVYFMEEQKYMTSNKIQENLNKMNSIIEKAKKVYAGHNKKDITNSTYLDSSQPSGININNFTPAFKTTPMYHKLRGLWNADKTMREELEQTQEVLDYVTTSKFQNELSLRISNNRRNKKKEQQRKLLEKGKNVSKSAINNTINKLRQAVNNVETDTTIPDVDTNVETGRDTTTSPVVNDEVVDEVTDVVTDEVETDTTTTDNVDTNVERFYPKTPITVAFPEFRNPNASAWINQVKSTIENPGIDIDSNIQFLEGVVKNFRDNRDAAEITTPFDLQAIDESVVIIEDAISRLKEDKAMQVVSNETLREEQESFIDELFEETQEQEQDNTEETQSPSNKIDFKANLIKAQKLATILEKMQESGVDITDFKAVVTSFELASSKDKYEDILHYSKTSDTYTSDMDNISKEIINTYNELAKLNKLDASQSALGSETYNETASNKLAYLARTYNLSFEPKVSSTGKPYIEVTKQDVNNLVNSMLDQRVLNPDFIKVGDTITFVPLASVTLEDGTIRTASESTEENSPIGIQVNGELIEGLYLHDVSWLNNMNLDNTKEGIPILDSSGEVNTVLTAMPEVEIGISRGGKIYTNEDTVVEVANTVEISEGKGVVVIPFGKKKLALPVRRARLNNQQVDSIVNAVRLYLDNKITPTTQQLNNEYGVNILSIKGLESYINNFIPLGKIRANTFEDFKSRLVAVADNVPVLQFANGQILYGYGQDIDTNYISKEKNDNEEREKDLLHLRKHLETLYNHVNLYNLKENNAIPFISDNGEVFAPYKDYKEYAKDSMITPYLAIKLEDGTTVYTIQSKIHFDIDSIFKNVVEASNTANTLPTTENVVKENSSQRVTLPNGKSFSFDDVTVDDFSPNIEVVNEDDNELLATSSLIKGISIATQTSLYKSIANDIYAELLENSTEEDYQVTLRAQVNLAIQGLEMIQDLAEQRRIVSETFAKQADIINEQVSIIKANIGKVYQGVKLELNKKINLKTLEKFNTGQDTTFDEDEVNERSTYLDTLQFAIDPRTTLSKEVKQFLEGVVDKKVVSRIVDGQEVIEYRNFNNALSLEEEAIFEDNAFKVLAQLTSNFRTDLFTDSFKNANMNIQQLFIGDPANYYKPAKSDKSDIERAVSTFDNQGKRLAGDNAGKTQYVADPTSTFNYLVIADNEVTASNYEYIKNTFGEEMANDYTGINSSDAQEYTTLEEHLTLMLRRGYGHGNQQEVPYSEEKKEVNDGTQQAKLLFTNLLTVDGFINPFTGEKVKGRQLADEYFKRYELLFKGKYQQLVEDLQFNPTTGEIKNLAKLKKILVDEGLSRNYSTNDIAGFDLNDILTEFQVPLWLNNADIEDFLNDDGTLDLKRIPEEALEIFGYRIPTSGVNLISTIKVVGFLPSSMGDVVIAPEEFIVQMETPLNFVYRREENGKEIITPISYNIAGQRTVALNQEKTTKGRFKSEVIEAFMTAALDNEKEQLLDEEYRQLLSSISVDELIKLTQTTNTNTKIQEALLAVFVTISNHGSELKAIQSTINSDSAGVYATLFNNELWRNLYPYTKPSMSYMLEYSLLGKSDIESNTITKLADNRQDAVTVYKSLLSSGMVSVFSNYSSVVEARKDLLFDSENHMSLGTIIHTLKQNKIYNNALLDRLQIGRGNLNIDTTGKIPTDISYYNALTLEMDEEVVINSIIEMIVNKTPLGEFNGELLTSKDLADKLITHQIITGGVQKSGQFIKYIPFKYLQQKGYYNKLEALANLTLQDDGLKQISNMLRTQNIQHNPAEYYDEVIEEKAVFTGNYATLPDDFIRLSKGFIIKKESGDRYSIFKYDASISQFVKIDNLGYKGIQEYDISQTFAGKSTVYINQVGVDTSTSRNVSSEGGQVEELPDGNDVANFLRVDRDVTEDNSPLTFNTFVLDYSKRYHLMDNSLSVEDKYRLILKEIKDNTTSPIIRYFSNKLTEVVPYLSTVPLYVDFKLKAKGVAKTLPIVGEPVQIRVNPNLINSEQELQEVLIEEMVHALLKSELSQDTIASRSIKNIYNDVKAVAIAKYGKEAYDTMVSKVQKKMPLREGVERNILYNLYNIDEFVAAAIKDKTFQEFLNNTDATNTTKSLWTRFIEAIKKVLETLGVRKDSNLEAVLHETLNLFDNVNNNLYKELTVPQYVRTIEYLNKRFNLVDDANLPLTKGNSTEIANFINKNIINVNAKVVDNKVLLSSNTVADFEANYSPDIEFENSNVKGNFTNYNTALDIRINKLVDSIKKAKQDKNFTRVAELSDLLLKEKQTKLDLQEIESLVVLSDKANQDLELVDTMLNRPMTSEDIVYARSVVNFWKSAKEMLFNERAYSSDPLRRLYGSIEGSAELRSDKLFLVEKRHMEDFIKTYTGKEVDLDKQFSDFKDINFFQGKVRDISTYDNKMLDSIWLSIKQANIAAVDEGTKLLEGFDKQLEAILPILKGLNTSEPFDIFRQKTDDDELVLISDANTSYNFWIERNSPYNLEAITFNNKKVINVRDFNNVRYYEVVPSNKTYIDEDYKVIENNIALLDFYQNVDNILDELKQYVPERQQRALAYGGIPAIEKSLYEMFSTDMSKLAFKPIYDTFIKSMQTSFSDVSVANIDPVTGKPINEMRIPLIKDSYKAIKEYVDFKVSEFVLANKREPNNEELKEFELEAVDNLARNNSFDLGKIVKVYSALVLAHKHKAKLEDGINIGQNILNSYQEVLTRPDGSAVINAETGVVQRKAKSESFLQTKTAVDAYIKNVMYGDVKEEEGKGKTILTKSEKLRKQEITDMLSELENQRDNNQIDDALYSATKASLEKQLADLGKTFIYSKAGDNILKYVQLKLMGWNFLGGISNMGFGYISNQIEGAGGQLYTTKDLNYAYKLVANSMLKNATFNQVETETAKKIRSAMDKWDVLKDASHELYTASIPNSFTNKLKALKPYNMNQRTEYINQAPLLIALTRNVEVDTPKGKISLWEGYDENFNWKPEYGEEPKDIVNKTRIRLDQLIKRNHGNYDNLSPLAAKRTFMGRAVSQFRTWLYESVAVRVEKERYDSALDIYVKGRYRSVGTVYSNTNIGALAKDSLLALLKTYTFGLIDNTKAFNNLVDGENIKEVDAANMRKVIKEVSLALNTYLFLLLLSSLKGDDDDNKVANVLFNQGTRLKTDLLLYVNPMEARNIVRDLIPSFMLLKDISDWFESVGYFIAGEDEVKTGVHAGDSRLGASSVKMLPFGAKLYGIYNSTSQTFEK